MKIETYLASLPEDAEDLREDFALILKEAADLGLTEAEFAGVILALAYALKQTALIQMAELYAADKLSPEDRQAVQIALMVMARNNTYYRTLDLIADAEFAKFPAKFHTSAMQVIKVPKRQFEFYALSISMVNGCAECIKAHRKGLEKAGGTQAQAQLVLRLSAVLAAVAQLRLVQQLSGS